MLIVQLSFKKQDMVVLFLCFGLIWEFAFKSVEVSSFSSWRFEMHLICFCWKCFLICSVSGFQNWNWFVLFFFRLFHHCENMVSADRFWEYGEDRLYEPVAWRTRKSLKRKVVRKLRICARTCIICFRKMTSQKVCFVRTCKHSFCVKCMEKWIKVGWYMFLLDFWDWRIELNWLKFSNAWSKYLFLFLNMN